MKFYIALFVLLLNAGLFAQDAHLPNYMTPEEKAYYNVWIKNPPEVNNTDDINPPPGPVRTMAEWEECQGIIIKWLSFTPILAQIIDYAQEECNIYVVCTDSNTVKTYLNGQSIPLTNVKFIIQNTGGSGSSIWSRDYGPWAVYSNVSDSLKIIDWVYNRPTRLTDDTVGYSIARLLNIPIHETTVSPNRLVHTGGNFMVDGNGTGFSSKLILNENPSLNETQVNNIMNTYMGINRYIKMETLPYDEIHHIDMHIKLLDEETLLVSEYPAGVADGPQIEANLQYVINNFQTCYGKPYKVIRILAPPGPNGQYPNSNGDYRTYTNSLIINKTVIVPTFEVRYDTTALRIYRESMPGYKIVGINCNSIITSLGAVHCITKEIGVYEPVFISHSAIRNTNNTTQPYEVKAYIKTRSGVANAKVFWSTDTSMGFTQVNMTNIGDTFRANIPAQSLGTKVYYYISATSISGRTVTKPLPAPRGNIQFLVTNQTGITQINNEIPGTFALYQNYPNPFNPSTKINFDIPKSSNVTLRIYDITGREVLRVIDAKLNPGKYSYSWNAAGFSTGVYFYKLTGDGFTQTKKMLIVK